MTISLRLVAPLMLAVVLAGCDDGAGNGGNAQASPPPPEVTVAAPLVRKLTEWDEFTGRFEAVQRVEIRAQVNGYLREVNFEDGQIVDKGQTLFVIDPRPYQAIADQVKGQIAQAAAQVRLSQLEQERAQKLVSTSAIARATLDQRNAELLSTQATQVAAEAQLAAAQLNIEFTTVKAPFRGRVSDRRVDLGNLINNQTLLTTIVQVDPIYLTFDMSETDFLAYERVVAGGGLRSTRDTKTVIQAHLADEEEWSLGGTMDFVDNSVAEGTGTIRARAVIPNPQMLITPGQFGRIRIPGSPEYDALLIPDAAIVTDQSRKMVMTVAGDGTVAGRIIRPGPTQPGGLRIVRGGLEQHEKIIINGLIKARAGAKVTPKDGKIEPQPEAGPSTASAAPSAG